MFVRVEKKVTTGHSQESLIWTGSAAAEVRGHRSGIEIPKPITGQCGAEGLSCEVRISGAEKNPPSLLLQPSFNHLTNHDVATSSRQSLSVSSVN